MSAVGNRLMAERERRGLQRVDVARATGIFIHHLSALEHGNFEDLPDGATVAGYVRAYADYLDLDAAGLVTDFCDERGIEEPAEPRAAKAGRWSVGSLTRVLVFVLPIAVLMVVAILRSGSEDEPGPAGTVPPADVAPQADAAPVRPPETGQAGAAPEAAAEARTGATLETEPRPPASTLSVPEYGVGSGVVDRRLVGAGDRFAAGSKVWFWTRVRGGRPGQSIRHVWMRDGKAVETIRLTLGGEHWRTYSVKTVFPGSTGRWAVEARDPQGVVLARSEFTCVP